jgi:membrane-associated HD superfamily phosphohydrolase
MSHANPHDSLPPETSRDIILAHGKDGANMLQKHKMPKEIIDIQIKNIDLKKKIIFTENKAKVINDKTLEMIEGMKRYKEEEFLIQNQHKKQVKLSGIYFIINQYLGAEMKPQELLKYSHS